MAYSSRPIVYQFASWAFLCSFLPGPSSAEDPAKKYALLIGVTKFKHAEMNGRDPLQFPEEDAKAIGAMMKESGYEADYLLGSKATKQQIETNLKGLKTKAYSEGICLIG